ncbi:MAG: calcium-binding protein [Tepidisphaeraceae bacterium]
MESLEGRRLFTLQGVAALQINEFPRIEAFDDGAGNSGITYDGSTFSAQSIPLSYLASAIGPLTIIENGGLTVNLAVDSAGNASGTAGDDFVITGDVDTDGDGNTDHSGVLLTGELLGFGFEDTTPGTAPGLDSFDFRFQATGGFLLAQYSQPGKDVGVHFNAFGSTFGGSFAAPFDSDTVDAIITPVAQPATTPPPGGVIIIPDPCGNGNAVWLSGTSGNDFVKILPIVSFSGDGQGHHDDDDDDNGYGSGYCGGGITIQNGYVIKFNGQLLINPESGTTTFTQGKVIAELGDGNDFLYTSSLVKLAGNQTVDVWAYGQYGCDLLFGGKGDDAFFGGNGSDLLYGGEGRDFLVGGEGCDALFGSGNDDIIIAGYTNYDDANGQDWSDLCVIMTVWGDRNLSGVTRVNMLKNGTSGVALNTSTVFDDMGPPNEIDLLSGGSGYDWFFYRKNEDIILGSAEAKTTLPPA